MAQKTESPVVEESVEEYDPRVADLMEKLAQQEKEITAMKEAIASSGRKTIKIEPDDPSSKIVRSDKPEKGGGWVVKTKLPWNGVRSGIRFQGGYGVIDVMLKDSEKLAHLFEHDYGYEVIPLNAEQLSEVRRMREALSAEQPMSPIEKLLNTGKMK